MEAALREVFMPLLGPIRGQDEGWSDTILGLSKRSLLKDVLKVILLLLNSAAWEVALQHSGVVEANALRGESSFGSLLGCGVRALP